MPFGSHDDESFDYWKNIFDNLIKPSVESASTDIICYRAAEESQPGQITPAIIESLKNDFLCIADVTGKNANVYYELGLRDSWHNRTIIITQKYDDVVFDKKDYRAILYKLNDSKSQSEFNKRIKAAFEDILEKPELVRNSVQELSSKSSDATKREKFRQSFETRDGIRRFAETNLNKRISNLLSIMGYCNRDHRIKSPQFFTLYLKKEDSKNTLLLLMKSFDAKQDQASYLAEMSKNMEQFLIDNFPNNLLKLMFYNRRASDFFPLTKIDDITNFLFVMPVPLNVRESDTWVKTLESHFSSSRKKVHSPNIPLIENKISQFSIEQGNVECDIWDPVRLKELELKYKLTFSADALM